MDELKRRPKEIQVATLKQTISDDAMKIYSLISRVTTANISSCSKTTLFRKPNTTSRNRHAWENLMTTNGPIQTIDQLIIGMNE